jgi:putative oxidoreductase
VATRTAKITKLVLLLGVSGIFLAAGIFKSLDPTSFATAIFHYRILPWSVSAALGLYLPYLEMIAAISLWHQVTHRAALWILLLLLIFFTGALVSAAMLHLDITCGCFGVASESSLVAAIIRNILLIMVIIFLTLANKCNCLKSDTSHPPPAEPEA